MPPWLAPARSPAELDTSANNDTDIEADGDVEPCLTPWRVEGLALDALQALDLLAALPFIPQGGRLSHGEAARHPAELDDAQSRAGALWWGADLRYWGLVAKLCLEFLATHKYLPGIKHTQNRAERARYEARWLPVLADPGDRSRVRLLAQAMPPICRAVYADGVEPEPTSAPAPHELLDKLIKAVIDRAVRDWGAARLDRRRKAPEGIAGAWWSALWTDDGQIDVPTTQARSLVLLYDAWREWIGQLQAAEEAAFRLCFRLEPPEVDEESGRVTLPDWTLRYMLQANDDPSLLVPVDQVWRARGGTLRVLDRRFDGAQEKVLAGLGLAARLFPPIVGSLRTARPQTCSLTGDDAYAFLR
jgi:hypothetical protein